MNNQFIKQRADEWAKIIARFELSGLNQTEFAKQNNLKNHQISYWASRLKKEQNKVVTQKQNFVHVEVMPNRRSASELPDPEWLARFLKAYAIN